MGYIFSILLLGFILCLLIIAFYLSCRAVSYIINTEPFSSFRVKVILYGIKDSVIYLQIHEGSGSNVYATLGNQYIACTLEGKELNILLGFTPVLMSNANVSGLVSYLSLVAKRPVKANYYKES